MIYDKEGNCYIQTKEDDRKEATYDNVTKSAKWEIGNLKSGEEKAVYLEIKLEETQKEDTAVPIQSMVRADGTDIYPSNIEEVLQAATPTCTIVKETNLEDKYVYEDQAFEYIITVTNTGNSKLEAMIDDEMPEGIILEKINYTIGEKKSSLEGANINLPFELNPEEKIEVRAEVRADDIPNGQEQITVKNKAIVSNEEMGEQVSNEVSTIILNNPDRPDWEEDNNQNENNGNSSISGIAWVDSNNNGTKDEKERNLKDVPVVLYDIDGNVAKDNNGTAIKTTTKDDGTYEFTNLKESEYVVAFEYDSAKYALAEYKKTGVSEEQNSDVTEAELNGKKVAVTDTIQLNGNVSGINMGVVLHKQFDLRLDKYITGITVQDSQSTKKYNYNKADFAKVEINWKTVNTASIAIEYQICVTNESELEGQAKKVVDYLSPDLDFNSSLNNGWTEENGQLINTSLEDEIIKPGETKTLNLVLTKTLNEDNLGTVTNTAEILEDYNINFVPDCDSTPGNKEAGEDDMSTASVIIGLNTGRIAMYISLIVVVILALAYGIYEIKKKVIGK